jgi:hypothetical protein
VCHGVDGNGGEHAPSILTALATKSDDDLATVVRDGVPRTDGATLEGFAVARTSRELQLRTDDQKIHLLRKAGDQYRRVTSQADWPSMHGQLSGNRYAPLTQITPANVSGMRVKWVFAVPNSVGCRARRRSMTA